MFPLRVTGNFLVQVRVGVRKCVTLAQSNGHILTGINFPAYKYAANNPRPGSRAVCKIWQCVCWPHRRWVRCWFARKAPSVHSNYRAKKNNETYIYTLSHLFINALVPSCRYYVAESGSFIQGFPGGGIVPRPASISPCELAQLSQDCVERINSYRTGKLGFSNGIANLDLPLSLEPLREQTSGHQCSSRQVRSLFLPSAYLYINLPKLYNISANMYLVEALY